MKFYLSGFSAFALWGFSSLAVRPLSAYPSPDILFYRVLFAFALMLVVGLLFRGDVTRQNIARFRALEIKARKKVLALTLAGGVFLTSNWFFFIFIINHVNVKAASFSYLICPIVTMLLASFFLKEKLNRWQWAAVVLSVTACWLLSLGHSEDLMYSLIVAFSYGAYLVSQRANGGFDSLFMLTFHIAVALVILILLIPFYSFSLPAESYFYQYMAVLVILLTIVPLSLNLFALKGISSSAVGMLLYINPLINFVIAVSYFGEEVSLLQAISYLLIIFSILLFNKQLLYKGNRVASAA